MSPTVITEVQMNPYLIQSLFNPNHMAVVMVIPPATISTILAELRRLELISNLHMASEASLLTT